LTTGLDTNDARKESLPDNLKSTKIHSDIVTGFTLLELVLVMVIICTVLAMAAPSLRGFFASRETSDAASQIVSLTEWARSQAVAQGRRYRLNLDVEHGTYWLTVREQGTFENLTSEFGRIFSLPEQTLLELEAGSVYAYSNHIEFYSDGRAQPGIIRLRNRFGEIFEIVCFSPTERFYVAELERM